MADDNIQEATDRINESTKELDELLKKAQGPFNELEQTTENLNSAIKTFTATLTNAVNTQYDGLQELQKQQVASSRLRDIYGQYSGTLSGIIAIGKQNIANARSEANLVNARMDLAKQAMGAVQSQLDSVSAEISEREVAIQQATNRRELIDQERSVLSEFIKAKQEQIEATRGEASYTKSQLSIAQNELSMSKDRLATYRTQEESIKSMIDANNEEVRKLESRGEFRGSGPAKEVSTEELEHASILKAANEEHKRRYDELVSARKAEVAYRDSIYSTVGQLQHAVSAHDALQAEHDDAVSTMANLNKQRMFETTKLVEASSELKELNENVSELRKATDKATEAYKDVAAEASAKQQAAVNQVLGVYAAVLSYSITALNKTAKALLGLEKIIRDTQQQFGITAGQAANVKFGQLQESIKSTFNTFMTLGREARVSVEEIQAAQVAFQKEFGGVISTGAAAELAQQAKEMGLSVTELANARRAFLTTTLGNVDSAIAQQERAIASFEAKGLTAKDAMEFVGKNAELVARAGTRFQDSLMRAGAVAKKIGVDLSKVNQVGDNIIGNFEGFLTSMAELGAMGFGLDAARLGMIAESGDTGALFEELRSQLAMTGKDITQLRRSEQLALSQAFGMDIAEFQRMAGIEVTGGGETMEDLQKKSNGFLERLVNLFGAAGSTLKTISTIMGGIQVLLLADISRKLGGLGLLRGLGGVGRGVIRGGRAVARGAASVARTATGAARRGLGAAARGVSTVARGTASGIGTVAGAAGRGLSTVARGTTGVMGRAAGGIGSVLGGMGTMAGRATGALGGVARGAGSVARIGGRILGKAALPLAVGMGAFDAVRGFGADKEASTGQRLRNAGSSVLSGLTFGLLGKDASEISAEASLRGQTTPTTPTAPSVNTPSGRSIRQARSENEERATPTTTQVNVDLSALEKKLDQVVQAIGAMRVDLDGNKVGKILLDGERTTSSRATLLAQRAS
jgi:DNA repair exonuclease SbcCD ATPase subunit